MQKGVDSNGLREQICRVFLHLQINTAEPEKYPYTMFFASSDEGANMMKYFNDNFMVDFAKIELCNKGIKNDLIYITKM